MSIQYHKCNQVGCDGHIAFDNADFDYREALKTDGGVLDRPKCNKCGKEFLVLVAHVLTEFNEAAMELIDELPQCGVPSTKEAQP